MAADALLTTALRKAREGDFDLDLHREIVERLTPKTPGDFLFKGGFRWRSRRRERNSNQLPVDWIAPLRRSRRGLRQPALIFIHILENIGRTNIIVGIIRRMLTSSTSPETPISLNFSTGADWAEAEFGAIDLGDARCSRRLVASFACMLASPGQSIPQCTGSIAAARGFYRLLDNDLLTDTLIFDTHRVGVLRRAHDSGVEVLLAIQDTTTFNFDTRKSLKGLGSIGSNNVESSTSGLLVHSTLLTAADRPQVYGLLGAKIYARDPDKRKSQAPGTRNREPIDTKESIRWLESYTLAREAQQTLQGLISARNPQAPRPLIVSVGDREADIYELLVEAQTYREEGMAVLLRSQYNRGLVDETEKLLWERLSESPSQGTVELKLPRSQGQKPRTVVLSVRFVAAQIDVPAHKRKYLKMDTPVSVNVIELREQGVADGVCWRLVTTLPVEDLAQAVRMSRWYARRWQIEVFHRIVKSGCRVEARQLRTLARLRPALALDMVVACCLMGMVDAARDTPEQPASDWLDPDEVEALVAYHRDEVPAGTEEPVLTIGRAVRLIGRLGGHLGRKRDGPPGAEVLWRGLAKLEAITEAWRRFRPINT